MKSKNQRPKYFVIFADEEGSHTCSMLYAVYADGAYYESAGDWHYAGLNLDTFTVGVCKEYHPCSLADVRAAFNNIKAHKRDS